jgi:phosphoglycolate phosphatase
MIRHRSARLQDRRMFRAVIFDLDGTLVDSLADIAESMNTVLVSMGFPAHPLADYRRFVGDGMAMLARRVLPADRVDDATVEECVARLRKVYAGRATQRTAPYDGIPELLGGLASRGIRMAVLSNKPHDLTVKLVQQLFPRSPFEAVFGERPGIPRKPDPAGALEIAAMLGLDPSDFLYVGDTPTDVATARAAGMCAAGASWGFRDAEELTAAGAPVIVKSPAEVMDHLG